MYVLLSVHTLLKVLAVTCTDKTHVESLALSAFTDAEDRPKCLPPVWKFKNQWPAHEYWLLTNGKRGRSGSEPKGSWLWSEHAAKSQWTTETCTVTQNKSEGNILKTWFFKMSNGRNKEMVLFLSGLPYYPLQIRRRFVMERWTIHGRPGLQPKDKTMLGLTQLLFPNFHTLSPEKEAWKQPSFVMG